MMQDVILYRNPRRLKIVEGGNVEGGGGFLLCWIPMQNFMAHLMHNSGMSKSNWKLAIFPLEWVLGKVFEA